MKKLVLRPPHLGYISDTDLETRTKNNNQTKMNNYKDQGQNLVVDWDDWQLLRSGTHRGERERETMQGKREISTIERKAER